VVHLSGISSIMSTHLIRIALSLNPAHRLVQLYSRYHVGPLAKSIGSILRLPTQKEGVPPIGSFVVEASAHRRMKLCRGVLTARRFQCLMMPRPDSWVPKRGRLVSKETPGTLAGFHVPAASAVWLLSCLRPLAPRFWIGCLIGPKSWLSVPLLPGFPLHLGFWILSMVYNSSSASSALGFLSITSHHLSTTFLIFL
jgi:hypothetical protein